MTADLGFQLLDDGLIISNDVTHIKFVVLRLITPVFLKTPSFRWILADLLTLFFGPFYAFPPFLFFFTSVWGTWAAHFEGVHRPRHTSDIVNQYNGGQPTHPELFLAQFRLTQASSQFVTELHEALDYGSVEQFILHLTIFVGFIVFDACDAGHLHRGQFVVILSLEFLRFKRVVIEKKQVFWLSGFEVYLNDGLRFRCRWKVSVIHISNG